MLNSKLARFFLLTVLLNDELNSWHELTSLDDDLPFMVKYLPMP